MNELFAIGIVGSIAAIVITFFYGRRVQGQVDAGKSASEALGAIEKAINKNKTIEEDLNEARKSLADFTDDEDTVRFRMPGRSFSSPSRTPKDKV